MPQSLFSSYEKLSFRELCIHRIHACLGFYCLVHFGYRYGVFFGIGVRTDLGLDSLTWEKFLSIFLPHLLLQLSGFRFTIPRKRNPEGNRIWPQYRFEALVFFCRCLALMAISLFRKLHGCQGSFEFKTSCSVWPPALVVLLTSMSADWVASIYARIGDQSTTIRGLNGPPGALYLMSAAQFHANVHCLLIQDRLCVQLAALTVVQTTAFGMTLRRKRMINTVQGLRLYGLVLVLGMSVILQDLMEREMLGIALAVGNFAALLRFEVGMNKYLLWGLVACLLQGCAYSEAPLLLSLNKGAWRSLSVVSTFMLVAGAARRQGLLGASSKKKTA